MVTNPTTQGGKTSTSTNEMILGPPMWLWWASLTPTWTISPSKGPCNFCDIRQVKRYLAMSHGLSTWPKRFSWAKRRPSLICPNQWVDLYFQQFKQSSWSSLLTRSQSAGHYFSRPLNGLLDFLDYLVTCKLRPSSKGLNMRKETFNFRFPIQPLLNPRLLSRLELDRASLRDLRSRIGFPIIQKPFPKTNLASQK